MAVLCVMLAALGQAAGFQATTLHVPPGAAEPFLAEATGDGAGDICLLADDNLTVWPSPIGEADRFSVQLPKGVRAFDIADLDADGRPELVLVREASVWTMAVGEDAEATLLFERDHVFAEGPPAPQVLVARRDGRWGVALPTEGGLTLFSPDGEPVADIRGEEAAPPGAAAPPETEPAGYYWTRGFLPEVGALLASYGIQPLPDWTVVAPADDEAPATPSPPMPPRGEEAAGPWQAWRVFPVGSEAQAPIFAYHAPREDGIALRVVDYTGDDEPWVGPDHRFPGQLAALPGLLPDFNNDGYTDLLLWSAPRPGLSIDALTRTLTGRTWPLRVAVHLYHPAQRRFSGMPDAHLQTTTRVAWFLEGLYEGFWQAPVRHAFVGDVDGDGRDDLAWATSPRRYAVWRYVPSGFQDDPDFELRTTADITDVAFAEDLMRDGRTWIGLRAGEALHVLHYGP